MKNIKKVLTVMACLSIIFSFVYSAIYTSDNGISTYSDEDLYPIIKD